VSTANSFERDPVALDAEHYTVETENDSVRVVRIRYGAGEKSAMHQHPAGVVVFLTDADFKFTFPDGDIEEVKSSRGDFMTFDKPWEHTAENVSGQDFEAIYIEVKG
jgi:quercetin dioxygenase-like cupin family protein